MACHLGGSSLLFALPPQEFLLGHSFSAVQTARLGEVLCCSVLFALAPVCVSVCVCFCLCVGLVFLWLWPSIAWTGMQVDWNGNLIPYGSMACKSIWMPACTRLLGRGAATDVCHVILQVVCTAGLEASESVMLHHLHFWACTICSCATYFLL